MSRKIKNIICIVMLVLLLGAGVGICIYGASSTQMGDMPEMSMGEAPTGDMPQNGDSATDGDSDMQSPDGNGSDNQTPPEKSDGEDNGNGGGTPPSGMDGNDNSDGSQPDPPDNSSDSAESSESSGTSGSDDTAGTDNNNGGGDNGSASEMPEMGDGNAPSDMEMPEGMEQGGNHGQSVLLYILFGVDALLFALIALFMLLSKGNEKTLKEVFAVRKNIVIIIVVALVFAGAATAGDILLSKPSVPSGDGDMQQQEQTATVDATGALEITDDQDLTGGYTSENSDENAILVKDGGDLTLNDGTITKTGEGSDTDNSDFFGINAGLLVTSGSTAKLSDIDITTSGKLSNAVFATGENAVIDISDSTITTTGESSARGLDATYGGTITGNNLTISTAGGSCAALATDRGEGTIDVSDSTLSTKGVGSPVIYSTGDITITSCKGTATGSQGVVVEGKNSATVESSSITAQGTGNREDVDECGVFIYQSQSGDADEGTGSFTATDSTLAIDSGSDCYKSAPMFFVTNTAADITLTNTTLKFGSGVLLKIAATDQWGEEGSNGGDVTFTADTQILKGDVVVDDISSLEMTLKNSSFKGAINSANTAKSLKLVLDAGSELVLTGDTYITELEDADADYDNIDCNGYTLYVDGEKFLE